MGSQFIDETQHFLIPVPVLNATYSEVKRGINSAAHIVFVVTRIREMICTVLRFIPTT